MEISSLLYELTVVQTTMRKLKMTSFKYTWDPEVVLYEFYEWCIPAAQKSLSFTIFLKFCPG